MGSLEETPLAVKLLVKRLCMSVLHTFVNNIDLQALNLAGPTVTRPGPDPLAVLSLDKLA